MKPFILFDYIFYRIAFLYEHRFDYGQSKNFAGVGFLTLFEIFNLFTIFHYFELITKDIIDRRYMLMLAFAYIVLFVLNYFRYIKIIKYSELEERWEYEGNTGRHIKSLLILSYFVTSIILFVKI